jgi:hypothetical protein
MWSSKTFRGDSTDEKRGDWDTQGGDRLGLEVSEAKDRTVKLSQVSRREDRQFIRVLLPLVSRGTEMISRDLHTLAEPSSEREFLWDPLTHDGGESSYRPILAFSERERFAKRVRVGEPWENHGR